MKVLFNSPGTFFAEQTSKNLKSRTLKNQIKEALELSKSIEERYSATPYNFVLNNKAYFLPHMKIVKLKDIPKNKNNNILISNCESNGWNAIAMSTKGWLVHQPFTKKDYLLNENAEIIDKGENYY